MIIQRIKIRNYKTYLSLDLDLSVDDERSIVLIGGQNGGGKTTLFEAICGVLYSSPNCSTTGHEDVRHPRLNWSSLSRGRCCRPQSDM